jgi:hypothetical protein
MKNKLFAILAAFGMVASASAVKINNNLSINGFLDGSFKLTDSDTADSQQFQSDEAELNFILSNGPVSGALNLDSHKIGGDPDFDIEQAHFTYDLGNGVSVTFGRYGSALGFEREDPAGLYTYSRAYASANLGDVDSAAVEGITLAYAADQFSLAASFQNPRGSDMENNDLDLELSVSYTGIADTVIGGGFFFDNEGAQDSDGNTIQDNTEEENILNIHASRSFGKLLIGAEYTEFQKDAGDRDAFLVLVDYDYTDKIGVAVRISNEEDARIDGTTADYEKITIAPNYAITENLGAILEFSDVEFNNQDSNEIAVELTYTF